MEQICIEGINELSTYIVGAVGVVVTVASTLANYVKKEGVLGKIIHFLAVNIKVDKVK